MKNIKGLLTYLVNNLLYKCTNDIDKRIGTSKNSNY